MSPGTSVFFGGIVGLLLAFIRIFGWAWEGAALAVAILLVFAGLTRLGRPARKSTVPKPLEPKERWLIWIAALLIVLPSIVALPWTGAIHVHSGVIRHGQLRHDHGPVVLAMMIIAAASAALILLSGLVDWFYIRPYLRGGAGTVCATSFDEGRWKTITRTWLIHRAVATIGPIAGATAVVALAANTWIRPIDDTVAGVIAAAATIIGGYYIARIAPLVAIAVTPPVQVGDVVEVAEEFNVYEPERLREYFVADVALEGVKLLAVNADAEREQDVVQRHGPNEKRTHDRMVDLVDIGRLVRGRRPVRPCPGRCQKLTEHCACDNPWDGSGPTAVAAASVQARPA